MRIIICVMTVMCVSGMTTWLILFGSYRKSLWDVRSGKHNTPLIKKIISKYGDCMKLDINVQNVNAFVEKMLETNRICGLSSKILVNVGVVMKYLIVMTMVVGMFIFRENHDAAYVVLTIGAISTLALHLCEKLTDIRMVHKNLVVELVDFLENSGDIVIREPKYKPTCSKLTGRAAMEFEKMNRQYDKLNRKQEKILRTNAFVLKNNRQML